MASVARFFTCICSGPKHGALSGCYGDGASTTRGLCAWCVAERAPPISPIPNPPRVPCPAGTRGCGQMAAAPGRWWYCSPECIARNKERP